MTACRECKFWGAASKEPRDWRDLFGLCNRIKHPDYIREEVNEKLGVTGYMGKHTVEGGAELYRKMQSTAMLLQPAYVNDSSDYWATLWTKADFGCTAFEAKDD